MINWRDWRLLYFDHNGRITREAFWVGVVPLVVAYVLLASLLALIVRQVVGPVSPLASVGGIIATLVVAWPAWCLAAKRRHDRGGRGVGVAVYLLLHLLALIWRVTLVDFSGPPPHRLGTRRPGLAELIAAIPTSQISYLIVFNSISFFGLVMFYILCSTQGISGPNRYGPDPRAIAPTAT